MDNLTTKFLGVGLTNALGLWCMFVILTVGMKVITVKHKVPFISEIVQAV